MKEEKDVDKSFEKKLRAQADEINTDHVKALLKEIEKNLTNVNRRAAI